MTMLISVIVTTFNGERFIEEQLQSILEQSRPADEIIIGDDCSTDQTVQIIHNTLANSGYEGRVEVVARKNNIGLYYNIKDLIQRCSGDIIALADQDDIWLSSKLRTIEEYFTNHSDISALLTGFKAIDSEGNLIFSGDKDDNVWITEKMRNCELSRIGASAMLCRNYGPGCTLAVKRTNAALFLLSESHLIHDWQLCLISAIRGGLFYTPTILTNYRLHGGNTIGMPMHSPGKAEISIWRKLFLIPIYIRYCFFTADKDSLREDIPNLCFSLEMVNYFKEKYCIDNAEKQGVEQYLKYVQDYRNAINNHKLIKWFITITKNKAYRKSAFWNYSYENHLRYLFGEIAVILRHL